MALGRNIVANYLGQALRAVIGIVLVPIYIQYLGMESYGLIAVFGALQAWLVLLDLGLRPALGRELARFSAGAHSAEWIRDLLRSVELIGGSLSVLVAIGVVATSHWLAKNWVNSNTLTTSEVAQAFSVMGLVTALRFVENIYTSSLVGLQKQVAENAVSSILVVVRGLGAIAVLAWMSPTIAAFFVWQAVVSIASLFVLATLVYRALPLVKRHAKFSIATLAGVWKFATGMLVLTLQSLLLTNLDKVVLSRLLSLEEFGRYALASVLANTLGMLTQPVASALTPRFTELATRGDQTELERVYHAGSQAVSVLAGSAAIVLMTFSERVMHLWTKNSELSSSMAPVATLLVLGSLCNGLMYVPYQLQLAHGWTRLTTIFNTVLVAVVVPALLFVVPRYGSIGAAAVWAVLNASYIVLAIPLIHRRVLEGSMWRWYFADTAIPLLAACLTAQCLRILVPIFTSRVAELAAVAAISSLTLVAAALVAPEVRSQVRGRLAPTRR